MNAPEDGRGRSWREAGRGARVDFGLRSAGGAGRPPILLPPLLLLAERVKPVATTLYNTSIVHEPRPRSPSLDTTTPHHYDRSQSLDLNDPHDSSPDVPESFSFILRDLELNNNVPTPLLNALWSNNRPSHPYSSSAQPSTSKRYSHLHDNSSPSTWRGCNPGSRRLSLRMYSTRRPHLVLWRPVSLDRLVIPLESLAMEEAGE